MKFSRKFKKLYTDFTSNSSFSTLSPFDIYKEDYLYSNRLSSSLFNHTSSIPQKFFNDYINIRVAYSFYDDQDIYFIVYKNAITDNYCILLGYRNHKSYHFFTKSFFVSNSQYEVDGLFNTISVNNDLHDCVSFENVLQLFKNLKIVI